MTSQLTLVTWKATWRWWQLTRGHSRLWWRGLNSWRVSYTHMTSSSKTEMNMRRSYGVLRRLSLGTGKVGHSFLRAITLSPVAFFTRFFVRFFTRFFVGFFTRIFVGFFTRFFVGFFTRFFVWFFTRIFVGFFLPDFSFDFSYPIFRLTNFASETLMSSKTR